MINHRNRYRLSAVALAAIVGMLSVRGGVSASVAGRSPDMSAGGCCLGDSTPCCCEPMDSALTGGAVLPATGPGCLANPVRSCECRSGERPNPGRMPEPRSFSGRFDRDRGESATALALVAVPRSRGIPRLTLHAAGLAHSPVYLRNARLLI